MTEAVSELDLLIGTKWKKQPFIKRPWLRWGMLIVGVLYLIAAISTVEVNWSRVYEGLDRGWAFVVAFSSPDFVSRSTDIWEGMLESLIMTVASSVVGILISIPIGLGAARNIAPLPVYVICRGIVAISRSLQEIIVAILLVAIFGFGPLAGFLTLSFATIGFLSKLLAEDIEFDGQGPGRGDPRHRVQLDAVDQFRRPAAGDPAPCGPVDVPTGHQFPRERDSGAGRGRGYRGHAEHRLRPL